MAQSGIYFFIGTEAELIKLFPVMLQLQEKQVPYHIIASGQNDIVKSTILRALNDGHVDLELSKESDIKKSAAGLMQWFAATWHKGKKAIPAHFGRDNLRGATMVVHGDTVSTVMGAYLAKHVGMRVAHVEAGLRSHNWLNPFPEEIDRVLTSRCVRLHFAPGQEAAANLSKAKGLVVNTTYNTIADSLAYSRTIPCKDPVIAELQSAPYFVFVMHRQENLANKTLVRDMLSRALQQAESMHCVMILHKPTEVTLQEMGLLDTVKQNAHVTALPRVEYFDFMKLLEGAAFVITDGGSNQEELSYMGKPCLILRTHTERSDGLGQNVVMYQESMQVVDDFIVHYPDYQRPPIVPAQSPARMIATALTKE